MRTLAPNASVRWWRVALVTYGLLLTVSTHWPELALGTVESPAPDKVLHMIVFGATVLLLWQSRWFARPWVVVVIAMAWAGADELSQSLPILRRTTSVRDLVAGQMGIAIAVVWWWALAPVGGAANRARIAWQRYIIDDVLSRLGAWVGIGLASLLGAAVLGTIAWFVAGATLTPDYFRSAVVLGLFGGGVAGAHAGLAAWQGRRGRLLVEVQPCLGCGASCRDVTVDAQGRGTCPACGRALRRGQWMRPMELPVSALLRGSWRSVLVGIGVVVVAFGAYLVVLWLSMSLGPAKQFIRAWHDLPLDMRVAIDLTLLAVATAVAVRFGRTRQAVLFDRQDRICRICRHDLTGTTLDRGVGRCPECGTPFAALS